MCAERSVNVSCYYNSLIKIIICFEGSDDKNNHPARIIRPLPTKAAIWAAVRPTELVVWLLAPAISRRWHNSQFPESAAKCNAVYPNSCFPELTSAPWNRQAHKLKFKGTYCPMNFIFTDSYNMHRQTFKFREWHHDTKQSIPPDTHERSNIYWSNRNQMQQRL